MIMREKIGRAMFATSASRLHWEEIGPIVQGFWLDLADAALVALEEPTDAMVRAALAAEHKDDEWAKTIPCYIWCAMIRGAQNEIGQR